MARVYATQDVTRPATDDALRDRFIHTELNEGRIVEDVPAATLTDDLTSEYGRRLLDAVLT